MNNIPTIPLEKLPIERQLTLNIKKETEKPKMRMNPNIPMANLLKQHPKINKLLSIKSKTNGKVRSDRTLEVLEKEEKVIEKKDISGNVA
tara:strand:+ start:347 stop:616 length:270 start_codon:yes stop_codon:yes gene_type:complete